MSREQKNEIARTLCVRYGSCHECPSFPTCVVETFADRICDADYRKQSEGEWKSTDHRGLHIDGFMVCSVCDVMIPTPDNNHYCLPRLYYCCRCGAKMKGGADK